MPATPAKGRPEYKQSQESTRMVAAKSESKKQKMNQHTRHRTDQPEQRRKRHDLGMIFDRRVRETGFRRKKPLHHSFGASEATIRSKRGSPRSGSHQGRSFKRP